MGARASIRGLTDEFLEKSKPARIGPAEWEALVTHVTRGVGDARRVNRSYLLDVLHSTEIEVDRALGGLPLDLRGRVHGRDADVAAESLLAMSKEYTLARGAGDAERAEDVRRAVRQAKDRLKLTLRRTNLRESTRASKEDLLGWFLVWLENPVVFPAWLGVRRGSQIDAG